MSYTDSVILDYRPQRVWTSPVDLNLFLAGTGAATYFWGVLWGSWIGEGIGVLAVALGGLVTQLELGRPSRAWRALTRLGGSWMSRGVLFLSLFVVLGALSVLPSLPGLAGLPWGPSTTTGIVISTLAQIFALGVTFYSPAPNEMKEWKDSALKIWSRFKGECDEEVLDIILKAQNKTFPK